MPLGSMASSSETTLLLTTERVTDHLLPTSSCKLSMHTVFLATQQTLACIGYPRCIPMFSGSSRRKDRIGRGIIVSVRRGHELRKDYMLAQDSVPFQTSNELDDNGSHSPNGTRPVVDPASSVGTCSILTLIHVANLVESPVGVTLTGVLLQSSGEHLRAIAKSMEAGQVKTVVDSVYPFESLLEANAKVMTGRVVSKVVVVIAKDSLQSCRRP
ncbi:alcohol dehydrogenase, partial [Globisporangium splendens]